MAARGRPNDPPEAYAVPPVFDREDRACNGKPAELFFPEHAARYPKAAAWCHSCPCETECLTWALETRQSFGMWGGRTPEERREILARR